MPDKPEPPFKFSEDFGNESTELKPSEWQLLLLKMLASSNPVIRNKALAGLAELLKHETLNAPLFFRAWRRETIN